MSLKRLTFWGADDNDDSLPRAVMEGRKTVTADTVEDSQVPTASTATAATKRAT